jgi:hypothetical protein
MVDMVNNKRSWRLQFMMLYWLTTKHKDGYRYVKMEQQKFSMVQYLYYKFHGYSNMIKLE